MTYMDQIDSILTNDKIFNAIPSILQALLAAVAGISEGKFEIHPYDLCVEVAFLILLRF